MSNPAVAISHVVEDNESSTNLVFINNHSSHIAKSNLSILPTAAVNVIDNTGLKHTYRMLLDSGSMVSFLSESCVRRLGLARKNARVNITGLGIMGAGSTRGVVDIRLFSRVNSNYIDVNAYVLPKITSALPNVKIDIANWTFINKLKLADPEFFKPGQIDILLGVDKFYEILEAEQIRYGNDGPFAHKTCFGWVIAGPSATLKANDERFSIYSHHTCIDIDKNLTKFWEIENVSCKSFLTPEEQVVENNFVQSFLRDSSGRYIVRLPFKSNQFYFGDSYTTAVKRLYAMERRFVKNPKLKSMYCDFMHEYESLGHMELVTSSIVSKTHYYLPHHAVIKNDSSTTKIRLVFDGSAKSSSGDALNEILLPGPPILRELFTVCIRFRRHQLAFTADIEKMFRQIWVADEDRDFQRILWRYNPEKPIQHFRLNTVTYGTTSAPFLANRVLKQLALGYQEEFPLASKVILNDFYVDDVMSGADTVGEMLELKNEMLKLLMKGGFILRKWITNCWDLYYSLPESYREMTSMDIQDDTKSIKVLGLRWQPLADHFSYKVITSDDMIVTKRKILSDSARIFDPLGFLTPAIVLVKALLQQLWLVHLDWDDIVPDNYSLKWLELRRQLKEVEGLKIPRKLWVSLSQVQFHGFCDASQIAFAAVIYCRSVDNLGNISLSMVAAKSRVAPLKDISIARLELCGALLLSRLFQQFHEAIPIDHFENFAWTDSEIVLAWLSGTPRKWKTFIANRVSEILENLPRNVWRHVGSESNPADCASRGLFPADLINHELWWNGPPFLKQESNTWPRQRSISKSGLSVAELEQKAAFVNVFYSSISSHVLQELSKKCSSWLKFLRIVAYCLRFSSKCRLRKAGIILHGILKLYEMEKSFVICIKYIQDECFSNDLKNLRKLKNTEESRSHKDVNLQKQSKLIDLNPFLDENDVIRVGGRIDNSNLSFNQKHPIILPKDHPMIIRLIQHYHVKYLHVGSQHLFVILKQEFWILGCRNLVRKVVHECISCFRQRRDTSSQFMANLLSYRVSQAFPFAQCGVDYAGPITLRLFRGRNPKFTKGYISLFVCLSTKAIHLELVNDLTSESFIAALRRFMARRGKCSDIYSDNGTNFQGAARIISEMHQVVLSESFNTIVEESLACDGIRWHFIPPAAPHFGGVWESNVKSVKQHLGRVIGNQILTFEEMYTLLTQIEALLNCRPLCAVPDTEVDILTPSHFLIGRIYTALPEPSLLETSQSNLKRWQLIQNMTQGFWKRWHQEYLTSLQQRAKWQTKKENISVGATVVVKDKNLPPSKWPLAVVTKVISGDDEMVRVVQLKTANGVLMRPITKLAPLPID